jgi:two-component sensor histidine kinase/PAS domain-containing protein
MALLILSSVMGLMPLFFTPGVGPTVLRQVVLSGAIEFFAISSLLFFWSWIQTREDFFFWLSLGTGAIAVGDVSILLVTIVADPLSWTGRIAQCTGASLILIAILVAQQKGQQAGHSLLETIAGFFNLDIQTTLLSTLVRSLPDEVWFASADRKLELINPEIASEFGSSVSVDKDGGTLAAQSEVYRPDGTSRPSEEAPAFRALKGEIVRNQEEIVRTPHSGELRYRQVSASPVRDAEGTIIGSVSVVRDITENKRAEEALFKKNEELRALNDTLSRQQQVISDALVEKEVLLSEVHHRVKNNLTAFISLLSLEGSYDDSPAGFALKKDLQNRARSMALIHETLYKTKNFSKVDMEMYLSTLIGQVISSYETGRSIKTIVGAKGVTLDLSRATPAGLIVNELVTNSLKYAFPESFDCMKIRGGPCTVWVGLVKEDGTYVMTVKDNGIGLPGDFDIAKTKTLGLKLVNFLAHHQMKANVTINSGEGAEFILRFGDNMK